MQEIAFVSIPEHIMPSDIADLRAKLEASFPGRYIEDDDLLKIEVDGVTFGISVVPATDNELDPGPGLDVASEENDGDVVASFIELGEALENLFPGSEVCSAWDE